MLLASAAEWHAQPRKAVALFGMSGVGKTRMGSLLRDQGGWFHYSVDYRIGTRYMNEHIVDNFKREAMKNPFLRDLLMSDSIYICSNISFNNLEPLSTYLGKPGNEHLGGIPFAEYLRRQRQHREAEIAALRDAPKFFDKAKSIYGYDNFLCDTGGSICEVVDPENRADPVMTALSEQMVLVYIRGADSHAETLAKRFDKAPKPMCYREDFLVRKWAEYKAERGLTDEQVNPDDFIRWGFRQLLAHRAPIYATMARKWGYVVEADEVEKVRDATDFNELIGWAIERSKTMRR